MNSLANWVLAVIYLLILAFGAYRQNKIYQASKKAKANTYVRSSSTAYAIIHIDTTGDEPRIVNAGIYSSDQLTGQQGRTDAVVWKATRDTYQNAHDTLESDLDHPFLSWVKPLINKPWHD